MDIYSIGIKVDSRQVKRGQEDLNRFGQAAKTTESTTAKLGRTLAKLGGAVGGLAVLRQSISTVMDFNKAISGVQAVTGAAGAEIEAMEAKARELGATTQFSATQAANAFEFLGMAGFSASQSVESIGSVLDLAAASGMDLARAADISSNVLSGFQLEAKEAGRMADVLAKGASSANTNVEQLGNAMQFVAPVAATLGISVEESTAAIGALSNAGIQGQKAGTGLRRVLIQLIKPTKQAQQALSKYGLSLEEVDPSVRNFTDILQTLRERNISAADSAIIFGAEGVSAYQALAGQISGIRRLNDELNRADGAALEMASQRTDNLAGDLRDLSSAFSELQIALLGDEVDSALRSATQAATALTRVLGENADAIKTVAEVGATLVAIRLSAWAYGAAAGLRSLAGAAALLTGPAAPFIVLGGILATIRLEMLETKQETEEFADSIRDLTQAQLENAEQSIRAEMRSIQAQKDQLNMFDQFGPEQANRLAELGRQLGEVRDALEQVDNAGQKAGDSLSGVDATSPDEKEPQRVTGPDKLRHVNTLGIRVDLLKKVQNATVEATEKTSGLDKAMQDVGESLQDIAKTMTDDVSDGLTDIIMQAESASDVFENLAKQIARTLVQQQIADPIAQGITSFASGLFGGGATGGSTHPRATGDIQGTFANGGNVSANMPAIVGERGPEMFIPGQDGRIVPNHQMGGGGNVTVNVINQGGEKLEAQQQQTRRGPNGEMTVDVMVKSSMERLDSQGQLDGIFRRHGARRQGQF